MPKSSAESISKAGGMWENSGGGLLRNHCFISSTEQLLALMKLRWTQDSKPGAPPVMLPSTMTMGTPRSLTERCCFRKKLEKVNRITLQCSGRNPQPWGTT